jgi:hypothetical protein
MVSAAPCGIDLAIASFETIIAETWFRSALKLRLEKRSVSFSLKSV